DLDAEAARGGDAVPRHLREPLGVALQRLDVGAVLTVDRDSLPEGDVADDLVARERRAALREPDEDVVHAADRDSDVVTGGRVALPRRLERNGLLLDGLLRLQPLDDLVDDLARLKLPGAEREVEVLGLLEAALADHLREHRRALQLPVGQVLLLQRRLERLTA